MNGIAFFHCPNFKVCFADILSTKYLYLTVPFWYASTAYQTSLVEPWFVFRDTVETKYPLLDQTSLIPLPKCTKMVRLDIYCTQILLNFRYPKRLSSRKHKLMPVVSYSSRYVSMIPDYFLCLCVKKETTLRSS